MCLDAKAMRSWRALKGWETRRRREAANSANPPFEGGPMFTRAQRGNLKAFPSANHDAYSVTRANGK